MSEHNGTAEDLARLERELAAEKVKRPVEEYKPNWTTLRATGRDAKAVVAAPQQPRQFNFITCDELAEGDYRPDWLIKNVIVKGQPGIVAGPSKALKTNISIDLAVSLGSGKPFLGEFAVPEPLRVAVVSGESGAATLQETARRVCKAKGLDLAKLGDSLLWCFDVPTFSDLDGMDRLADYLRLGDTDLVLLDPLYLMLGDIDAKNMFEMGGALRVISEVFIKNKITPLIVHHANKQLPVGEPMELAHLAYSGLEQYARQFILLNRRERYGDDGNHDLWLRCGGSQGHGGLWNLHVEEGVIGDDFSGRRWAVTVSTIDQVKKATTERKEQAKREAANEKAAADQKAVMECIDNEAAQGKPGATQRRVREWTNFGQPKCRDILELLAELGLVEETAATLTTGNGTKMNATVYRRPQPAVETDLLTTVDK